MGCRRRRWLGAGDDEPASEPSTASSDPQAETRRAFAQAMLRFGEVQSFSYSGSVRATTARPFGAGAFAVGDLTVDGAVLLQSALARQVAEDARGRAGETLTSGATVWTRSAPSADTLDVAPWAVRPDSLDSRGIGLVAADTLDMQLVARLMTTAGNPRGEAPDDAGRRVIRATLPTREDDEGSLLPLAGADMLLSLDDAGNIAHVVVTWPPQGPQLVIDVEISGHNQPQDIAPARSRSGGRAAHGFGRAAGSRGPTTARVGSTTDGVAPHRRLGRDRRDTEGRVPGPDPGLRRS